MQNPPHLPTLSRTPVSLARNGDAASGPYPGVGAGVGEAVGEALVATRQAFDAAVDSAVDSARDASAQAREAAQEAVATALEPIREAVVSIRPKMRGWLHAGLTPLTLVAAIVLIAFAPAGAPRVAAVVFGVSSVLLFSVSAIYNTCGPSLSKRAESRMQRFDHANIFILIAGSYTPFALLLLEGATRPIMLSIVWAGALAGAVFRVAFPKAPRWLTVPCYVALGWAAIPALDDFSAASNPAVITLLAVGGGLYTLGGAVYAFRRPNPFPQWFGFHEVFHACTVVAFIAHYIAVSIITYR